MKKIDFMKENDIIIFAEYNIEQKNFSIEKIDGDLEYYSLFDELIFNTKNYDNLDIKILPHIWKQGNTICVMSKPNENILVFLFYDNMENYDINYDFSIELDDKINKMYNS